MSLVIILGIAVVLFVLAFVTKRRFGVLGLGLAAGVILSQQWSGDVAALLQAQGINLGMLSYGTAAIVMLTLLPSLILMIAGPRYHDVKRALIGSLAFALLAVLFVVTPLMQDFSVVGDTNPVLDFISQWRNILVAAGVGLAIVDMFTAHKPRPGHKGAGKHGH